MALADKIDTLVGFFAIGEKPTGSRDPFALRRAALGVIRLIVENGLRMNLEGVFKFALQNIADSTKKAFDHFDVLAVLSLFLIERLKVALRDKGMRYDIIEAAFAQTRKGNYDILSLIARVDALSAFLKTEDGEDLLTAYRRASNILRIEEKKSNDAYLFSVCAKGMLGLPEAIALHEALTKTEPMAKAAIEKEDFTAAMSALSGLRGSIDNFFDKVMVNDPNPDVRKHRLHLLAGIRSVMSQVADFSKVEGGEAR